MNTKNIANFLNYTSTQNSKYGRCFCFLLCYKINGRAIWFQVPLHLPADIKKNHMNMKMKELHVAGHTKSKLYISNKWNAWCEFIHTLDFRACWFRSFALNFKCLNLTNPQHPLRGPFHHLSFNFSFFDFPFPSKHITLLVCQLSPKRLQASFLNNRSNQLPSLPLPLCVPLYFTLFSSRECKGRIIFPNNSAGRKMAEGGERRGRKR